MVPDVELLAASTLLENNPSTQESMPVYHGSIVRVENASDLIVRVPNFQRLSLPSLTISNDTSLTESPSTGLARTKRRAPLCPLLHGSPPHSNPPKMSSSPTPSHTSHRLTEGIRSLSRALTHGCRAKRSSSITEVTYPAPLPDVEVMKDRLPKLTTPKVFFLKRQAKETRLPTPTEQSQRPSTEPVYYAEVNKAMAKTTSFMHRFESEDDLEGATSIDLVSEGKLAPDFPSH